MATLALGLVGAALASEAAGGASVAILGGIITAGAAGFAVGAAAGGIIDSMYVYPALFGPGGQNSMGPRLYDIPVQSASEGSPKAWCFGPETRVGGTIIWLSDLLETQHEQDVGGGGKGGGGSSEYFSYTYSASLAFAVCKGPIAGIDKIWADSKCIYDSGNKDTRYDSITIYLGDDTQTADPIIQASEGASVTPAYRGTAYVVFENFQLQDWGNRVPQFSFKVKEAATRTVGEVISTLLDNAKVPSTYYDTTGLTDQVQGYLFSGPSTPINVIEPLLQTTFAIGQDLGSTITFFRRSTSSPTVIDDADVGVWEESGSGSSDDGSDLWKVTDIPDNQLPTEVVVTFVDPVCDYQNGSQSEVKQAVNHRNVSTIQVPITMTADTAKTLARRALWSAWAERRQIAFTLPPKYMDLVAGDLVTVKGENWRLSQVSRGYNMLIQCSGVSEQGQTLTQTAIADGPVDCSSGSVDGAPTADMVLLDIPPLAEAHANYRGLYAAVSLTTDTKWRGAVVWRSGHSDIDYDVIKNVDTRGTIGTALTTLPSGPVGYWDRTSTVDVEFAKGFLSSVTEDACLGGKNRAWIGGELIAYQNAELISTGRYRLSMLLRGLRDTEGAVGTHAIGDRFVKLDTTLKLIQYGANFNNVFRYYKATAKGQSLDDANWQHVETTSATLRPLKVAYLTATRDGSNNITLTWVRRSRAPFCCVTDLASGVPLLEPTEKYDVDFLVGGAVKRTKRVSDPLAGYTAAEQTSDGVTPGTTVVCRVFQINTLIGNPGRGNKGEVTI